MTELTLREQETELDREAAVVTVKSLPAFFLIVGTLFSLGFGLLVLEVIGGIVTLVIGAVCGLGLLLIGVAAAFGMMLKLCVQGTIHHLRRS